MSPGPRPPRTPVNSSSSEACHRRNGTGDEWTRQNSASDCSTSAELAAATRIDPRYAAEWLEQQTVTGLLDVDDPDLPGDQRRYALPARHTEVLTDPDSLNYLAPFMRLMTAAGMQLPALVEAYRTGGGVGWSQYGPDMRTGQAEMNRPWFLGVLGTEWFPAVP